MKGERSCVLLLISLGFYATSADPAGAQPLQATAAVGAPTTISEGLRFTIHSAILGEDRSVFVSTPPSYDGARRYPVLYLTDVQFNFDEARSSAGRLDI